MNTENNHLLDLKNYWFAYQYYIERNGDIERLVKEIYNNIAIKQDMEHKGIDISLIEIKIQQMKDKKESDLKVLEITYKKFKEIENKIEMLEQPYKNILFLKYIKNL